MNWRPFGHACFALAAIVNWLDSASLRTDLLSFALALYALAGLQRAQRSYVKPNIAQRTRLEAAERLIEDVECTADPLGDGLRMRLTSFVTKDQTQCEHEWFELTEIGGVPRWYCAACGHIEEKAR